MVEDMIKKHWNVIVVMALIIFIFPVLVTFSVMKMNGASDNERNQSGKTVEMDCGGYVVTMDMEDFIPCVLMAQMSIDSPMEAMKAQVVVIRTYILQRMKEETTISTGELGLPFISYAALKEQWFQEYKIENPTSLEGIWGNLAGIGSGSIFDKNIGYLRMIVNKTDGKVMKNNGELILPLFHGISNGNTRNGSEVIGSGYSYLKSVKCDTDLKEENYIGTKYFTIDQLREKLMEKDIIVYKDKEELLSSENIDLQELLKLIELKGKDQVGYVTFIQMGDTVILADKFAEALGLNSTSMEIEAYEKGIRITTKGMGHGLGMSLSYAKQLAANGEQWQDILKRFYDVTISDY